MAIYSKTERSEGTFFFWDEQHLYGSVRLGIETTTLSMRGAVTNDPLSNEVLQAYAKYGNQWRDVLKARYYVVGRYIDQVFMDNWGESWEYRLNRLLDRGDEDYILQQTQNETYTITLGNKQYELSNHLGNVLAVVSDKKLFIDNTWQATVLSAQDYYPFGMSMPNRKWQGSTGGSYRFSFNGKEDDTEWGAQDYGMRIYDKSIAKFLSVDPLTKSYPELTPYQFASNTPIMAIDLDGLEANVVIAGNGNGRPDKNNPQNMILTQYEIEKDYPFFLKHAKILAKRIGDKGRYYISDSGDHLIDALKEQTQQQGTINSVIFLGHGTPAGLTMDTDEGFYRDPDKTPDGRKIVYPGYERRATVDDLKSEVANGTIKFEPDAVFIIGSCNGGADIYQNGNENEKVTGMSIANRLVSDLGITVIAADNKTNIIDGNNKLTTDGIFYKFEPIRDSSGKVVSINKTALGKTIDPKDFISKK